MENSQQKPKPEPGRSTEANYKIFEWVKDTGLVRERGWIGGVLGALNTRTGIDTILLRGITVVLAIILTSPTVLTYGLAWLLLPDRKGVIHGQELLRGKYDSAALAAGALVAFGALTLFSPFSLAGPFSALLNIILLTLGGYFAYRLARKRSSQKSASGSTKGDSAKKNKAKQGSGQSPSTGQDSNGQATVEPDSVEADSEDHQYPAWYPKDSRNESPSLENGRYPVEKPWQSTHRVDGKPEQYGRSDRSKSALKQPKRRSLSTEELAAPRRRRLITWGTLMIAVPAMLILLGMGVFSDIALGSVIVVGLALLVIFFACRHMIAALRGNKGHSFALVTLTGALFLALLFGAGNSTSGSQERWSNQAFGQYQTQNSQVNAAFSNSLLDFSHIFDATGVRSTATDVSTSVAVEAGDINTAFANMTILVPDDTRVVLDQVVGFSRVEVLTQHENRTLQTFDIGETTIGPPNARQELQLGLKSAFGNVTIYDATTYEEQNER